MTYKLNRTLPEEFLESIAAQGMDVLPELIQTLVNATMWLERQDISRLTPSNDLANVGAMPTATSPKR